jgi:hypothetical protein
VRADTGGVVQLGRAEIDVPANALDRDTTVSIRQEAPPPEILAAGGPSVVYRFEIGAAKLNHKIRLFVPSVSIATPDSVTTLAYADGLNHWAIVPATVAGDRLTAEVDHLSLWVALDIAKWLLSRTNLVTHLDRILNLRGESPQCAAGRQGGASLSYPGGTLPQPALLTCIESDTSGNTVVKIVNNRSYAVTVEPTSLITQPVNYLDSGSFEHAISLLLESSSASVVPPGGERDFLLDSRTISGYVLSKPNPLATLAFVAANIVAEFTDRKFATDRARDIVDCARRFAGASNLGSVTDALIRCGVEVIWNKVDFASLAGVLSVPKAIGGTVLAYILTSVSIAVPTLDAWADLTLFNTATGRLTLTHALVKAPEPKPPAPPTNPAPPPPVPVVHYNCPNDNSNIGKYVPPAHYWQNVFTAQGSSITGGWVNIGAKVDGGNHQARVGIYGSAGLANPLAETILAVTGYDGESFVLSSALKTFPGQQLYLTVIGVGDFTAYDNVSGCFIGRVDGYR